MTDKENQIDMKAFSDGYDQGYADGYADCKKEWIEKACEWLDEHWNDYFGEDGDFNGWCMMRDFRKFMEE